MVFAWKWLDWTLNTIYLIWTYHKCLVWTSLRDFNVISGHPMNLINKSEAPGNQSMTKHCSSSQESNVPQLRYFYGNLKDKLWFSDPLKPAPEAFGIMLRSLKSILAKQKFCNPPVLYWQRQESPFIHSFIYKVAKKPLFALLVDDIIIYLF